MYLRPYRPTDFEEVFHLDVLCFDAPFRFSRRMMREVVSGPNAVVLLACEGGVAGGDGLGQPGHEAVLGFCAWSLGCVPDAPSREAVLGAYLATLDVHPAHRRQGIGRRLVQASEARLRQGGCALAWLHVSVGNASARALYGSLGYALLRREKGFYGRGSDAWVFARPLTGGFDAADGGAGIRVEDGIADGW